jgi:phosphate transport system substrate-binding protein
MKQTSHRAGLVSLGCIALALAGCSGGERAQRTVVQNKGSDTMVNLAQAWAETYRRVNPDVAIAVSGGGSGTGIAALINGTVDLANASRDIKPEEQESIRKANGKPAVEHVVAFDAVVFYVHADNPLSGLTLDQLACIYGEGGECETWTQVGAEVPGCAGQSIIRVSRQSNSGTYEFVRDHVLGKERDFKLGSRDMQGSKDVVDLVEHTPCAIGYSGIGYATQNVKALCVSNKQGEPCVAPSVEAARSKVYPLARPLFMYTLGEAEGAVAGYLAWIDTADGQRIVGENGFVPIR